ncbi:MAG: lysine--tRNA ligase [Chloroflexi bacterium]|nr:lysine--tRNA ligase [Chloroflexota bacterium]
MPERNERLFNDRLEKLNRLRARGIDPFPVSFKRTHTTVEAVAALEAAEASGQEAGPEVITGGRIRLARPGGKLRFMDIGDSEGKVQLLFKIDVLGEEAYGLLKDIDLGDFVGVRGPMIRTRTGEATVQVEEFTVLAKSLQPPPEKWHGLTDVEARFRYRYLDLMSNEEARRLFRIRSSVIAAMRRFMDARGFIEVETPVLVPDAGGAAAKPFTTFYNALDEERALRIATELYLKRLIVGGLDKVYEIGRIFRNEGTSTKHNPEFTMMESYEAYADYSDVAAMVEQLVSTIARDVLGGMQVPHKGGEIDFTPPWPRRAMRDLLIEHAGLDFEEFRTEATMREELHRRGIDAPSNASWGKLLDEAWSTLVEPHLIQPVFVIDYPVELSPLAKSKPGAPGIVERFEAFAGGFEIGNAYSELNDPIEQRRRFQEQLRLRARGDDEAEMMDEDFLFALEHGMPPTGGLGIGIDRLLMILTDQANIREIILFPQLRRESGVGSRESAGAESRTDPSSPTQEPEA